MSPFGCVVPRHTVWKCFGCQTTRLGHPQGSEGARRGPKNENCHILAVSTPETASGAVVGPGTPETGPNRVFSFLTQQLYGKRVTWVHPARPARCSFWVRCKKWTLHFGPLGPEKRPKRPVSGHRREKPNRRLRRHRNFGRFTPWNHPD